MCKADYHVVEERCERTKRTYARPAKKVASDREADEKNAPKAATARPGQTCVDGEACTGGAICKDGFCVCAEDEVIVEDKCVSSDGQALQVSVSVIAGA